MVMSDFFLCTDVYCIMLLFNKKKYIDNVNDSDTDI